jgi:hypothetical protein
MPGEPGQQLYYNFLQAGAAPPGMFESFFRKSVNVADSSALSGRFESREHPEAPEEERCHWP